MNATLLFFLSGLSFNCFDSSLLGWLGETGAGNVDEIWGPEAVRGRDVRSGIIIKFLV